MSFPVSLSQLKYLSDVLVGKQSRIFLAAIASAASENRCLTFVCGKKELNLECGAPNGSEVVELWLEGLNHILTGLGKTVLAEDDDAAAAAAAGASAPSTPSKAGTSPSPSAAGSPSSPAKASPAAAVAPATPGLTGDAALVEQMTRGSVLTLHQPAGGAGGAATTQRVTMWYAPTFGNEGPGSNSLCWAPVGQALVATAQARVPLRAIIEVMVGKMSASFQALPESAAKEDLCFSVAARGGRVLDLEAGSEAQRDLWLDGLTAVLAAALGRRVIESAPMEGEEVAMKAQVAAPPAVAVTAAVAPAPTPAAAVPAPAPAPVAVPVAAPVDAPTPTPAVVAATAEPVAVTAAAPAAAAAAPEAAVAAVVPVAAEAAVAAAPRPAASYKGSRRMSFIPGAVPASTIASASAPAQAPVVGPAALQLSGSELYRLLLEGRAFTSFSDDAAAPAQRVWLFFRPDAQAAATGVTSGALHWCPLADGADAPAGEPALVEGCALPLAAITDVYLSASTAAHARTCMRARKGNIVHVAMRDGFASGCFVSHWLPSLLFLCCLFSPTSGKQTATMQGAAAASAPAACCVSILAPSPSPALHLAAASPEALGAFLAALSNVFNGSGREVVVDAASAAPTAQQAPQQQQKGAAAPAMAAPREKRYSIITRSTATAPKSLAGAGAVAPSSAAAPVPAAMSLGLESCTAAMVAGQPFTRWAKDRATGAVVPTPITLFYAPGAADETGSARLGSLYYCPRGERTQASNACVHLSALRELFLGKQSPRLSCADARAAADNRCVSLITSRSVLDLEAASAEALSTFLTFVNQALGAGGAAVVLDSGREDYEQLLVASASASGSDAGADAGRAKNKDRRRFSIMPSTGAAASGAEAAEALAPPSGSYKELLVRQLETEGVEVVRYSSAAGVPPRAVCLLYYQPTDGPAGALHLSRSRAREAAAPPGWRVPLDQVADIFTGKARPTFAASFAHLAKEECCASIVLRSAAGAGAGAATGADVASAAPASIGEEREFHVEFESGAKLVNTLTALNWLLASRAGKAIELVEAAPGAAGGDDADAEAMSPRPLESMAGAGSAAAAAAAARKSVGDPVRRRFSMVAAAHANATAGGIGSGNGAALLPSSFSRGAASESLRSIMRTGDFSGLPQGEQGALEAALGLMERGTVMTGYAEDRRGNASKRLVLLWLHRARRVLYWCAPDTPGAGGAKRESPQCALALRDVSGILVGASARIFGHRIAADAAHHLCFSIVGDASAPVPLQLDLETSARTPGVLAAWVAGLQALLAQSGRAVLVSSAEEAAAESAEASARRMQATSARRDRRFSVLNAAASNQALVEEFDLGDVLASSAADLLRDLGSGRIGAGAAAPALAETLRMMERGHPAVLYGPDAEATGAVVASEVFLRYVPPPPSQAQQGGKINGSLVWSPRDERAAAASASAPASASGSLDLRGLKTVILKKNTPAFQSGAAAHVNKHRCFSLQGVEPGALGKPVELNVEMDSPEQVAAWLAGIYALVSRGGMDAVLDDPTAATGAAPGPGVGPSARAKRFSIISPSSRGGSGTGPAVAPRESLKAALEGNTEDSLRVIEAGTEFQSYELLQPQAQAQTQGAAGSPVSVRTILAWYAADDTRLGSIYWCAAGAGSKEMSRQRRIPLHEITDVYTGKQTKVFAAGGPAAQAVEAHCWSVAGRHDVLHLEAGSKAQLAAWLYGVNRLITRSGKKLVLESGAAPKDAAPIGRRRFSVAGGAAPPAPAAAAAATPPARLLDDCPLLHAGHVFVCYIEKDGAVHRTTQFVFCAPGVGAALGTKSAKICWCAPGFRVESELNCIRLAGLTDVYVSATTSLHTRTRTPTHGVVARTSERERHGDRENYLLDMRGGCDSDPFFWLFFGLPLAVLIVPSFVLFLYHQWQANRGAAERCREQRGCRLLRVASVEAGHAEPGDGLARHGEGVDQGADTRAAARRTQGDGRGGGAGRGTGGPGRLAPVAVGALGRGADPRGPPPQHHAERGRRLAPHGPRGRHRHRLQEPPPVPPPPLHHRHGAHAPGRPPLLPLRSGRQRAHSPDRHSVLRQGQERSVAVLAAACDMRTVRCGCVRCGRVFRSTLSVFVSLSHYLFILFCFSVCCVFSRVFLFFTFQPSSGADPASACRTRAAR